MDLSFVGLSQNRADVHAYIPKGHCAATPMALREGEVSEHIVPGGDAGVLSAASICFGWEEREVRLAASPNPRTVPNDGL